MKILIVMKHRFGLWSAPDWFLEKLREEFPEDEFVYYHDYTGVEADLKDAEVAMTWSLNAEQVKCAPRLRWIHSTAAAVHQLLIPEIVNSRITLTNASSVHGPVVAEHVLALMFALAKRLPTAFRMQQQRHWGQEQMTLEQPQLRELRDGTVGIVGVGSIGGEVARVASVLGMRVIGIRANPMKGVDWVPANDPLRAQHRVYGPKDIDRMLAEADFVVLSAPVTGSTTHLIGVGALAAMKPDAYLINVGRGALVDERALVEALQDRKIGGAALDVFEHEPLPADSPLWDLDNVIITPHQGGISHRLWERQYKLFSENLRRFEMGAPLLGLVDKKAGY